jgi:DNA polymerase III delta prime subunit
MRQPLYSKYKPVSLDEFNAGIDMISVIREFIKLDSISLLLIGDSGSGKTSLINAIIREYYGPSIPLTHDNIMSINTLKEQGIAYYRNDVKIFCQTASIIPGKKKILLLDDLDIINEQSQQVFRNCIDKHTDKVL